jgi:hypothetical protein
MTKIIKNFSEFQRIDEAGVMDFFSGLIGSGSTAFKEVIKGKVADYLIGFFGVKPESIFGTIVRNFAETVDVSELYGFITKGKGSISVKTLAPKLADVTMETLTEMGIDGVATRLGIEDKNGWIYRTMKEMISNQSKQADFREKVVGFWTMILTSVAGEDNKSILGKAGKNPFGLTSSEKKALSSDPMVRQAGEKSGMSMDSILKQLTAGATNPSGAMGTVGGQ